MLDTFQSQTKAEPLPFPFRERLFCRYEPIEKKIDAAKVLIVNNLLRYDSDLSDRAREDWGASAEQKLKTERTISAIACDNIAKNVIRLVKQPKVMTVHLSEVASAAHDFEPDAIVLSGTLSDFDYYNPAHLDAFGEFSKTTNIPILAICGGHQLISQVWGAELKTLDFEDPAKKRSNRVVEYQYRFVKVVDHDDPIFGGITDTESGLWQDYSTEDDKLRVWQNHGLQVVGVPEGFKLLATSYLCKNQMMVRRTDEQLIYTVQFHLEKSFEEWSKNPTRWEHVNESRDGRVLFENFLFQALEFRKRFQ